MLPTDTIQRHEKLYEKERFELFARKIEFIDRIQNTVDDPSLIFQTIYKNVRMLIRKELILIRIVFVN